MLPTANIPLWYKTGPFTKCLSPNDNFFFSHFRVVVNVLHSTTMCSNLSSLSEIKHYMCSAISTVSNFINVGRSLR
ncbi:unnamed protein product [Ixodes pacificus]